MAFEAMECLIPTSLYHCYNDITLFIWNGFKWQVHRAIVIIFKKRSKMFYNEYLECMYHLVSCEIVRIFRHFPNNEIMVHEFGRKWKQQNQNKKLVNEKPTLGSSHSHLFKLLLNWTVGKHVRKICANAYTVQSIPILSLSAFKCNSKTAFLLNLAPFYSAIETEPLCQTFRAPPTPKISWQNRS